LKINHLRTNAGRSSRFRKILRSVSPTAFFWRGIVQDHGESREEIKQQNEDELPRRILNLRRPDTNSENSDQQRRRASRVAVSCHLFADIIADVFKQVNCLLTRLYRSIWAIEWQ
jgi:hypothetical protein